MPNISVLMKPSSGNCNMHCDYCFYCDEMINRHNKSFGFMSEDTLKKIIKKTLLNADNQASFAFQGGEPMLRGIDFYKKAVEYENQYNRNNIKINNAFQTNGLLINEEWCEFFKNNNFLVGISLDGIKNTHDKNRHCNSSNSSFDRIMSSISLLKQYKVDFNILTVVHKDTAEHIEEIYKFYREQKFQYQQYIACLDPFDKVHGKGGFSLTAPEYGHFLIRLFNIWYKDWKKGRHPYIRQFDNYITMLMGYQPEACDQRGCCSKQYVSEADGGIYPCDFYVLDEYKLGNIHNDNFKKLDELRSKIGFVERSLNIDEECKKCPYYDLCRNGCHRMRDYDVKTNTWKNYLCDGYKDFFKECGSRLKEIAEFEMWQLNHH